MTDLSEFKGIYISEAEDHLQKLNEHLLKLEKDPQNKELLDEIMRSSHTIKGASATMGYKKNAFLAHVMEDVFDYARNGSLNITPEIINEVFKGVDALKQSIKLINENNQEAELDEISERIKKITGVQTQGIGKSLRTEDGKPIVQGPLQTAKQDKKITKSQQAKPVQVLPTIEKISHIKVPIERLDNLMDLMEELLIDKMKLNKTKEECPKIVKVVEHLNRLVTDIQFEVMQARLVPLEQIFGMFPRMVRDLATVQKKKIEFEISGADIMLDRTIVDRLGEPIMHLLRNAIDHGIEKTGKITLTARREKDNAAIIVEDNGKGINWIEVADMAAQKGIIDRKTAEKLKAEKNYSEIKNLLLRGISTKKEVTQTSGRGVGITVAKEFTDQVGGKIIIESPIAKGGTRFTLKLPFTLAIINSLLAEVDDTIYAIPFSVIERTVKVSLKDVKSMADQDMAVISGMSIPLINLKRIFNITKNDIISNGDLIVVLVKYEDEIAGIIVDNIIDKQEIVVKSLPPVLRGVEGFSGSSILGDGRTVLILDISSLVENRKKLLRI